MWHLPGWILCEVEALSSGWGSLEEDTKLKECQPDAGQHGMYLLPWAYALSGSGKFLHGPMLSLPWLSCRGTL